MTAKCDECGEAFNTRDGGTVCRDCGRTFCPACEDSLVTVAGRCVDCAARRILLLAESVRDGRVLRDMDRETAFRLAGLAPSRLAHRALAAPLPAGLVRTRIA